MSDAIYPALPGLAFNVMRSPEFNTKINTSASGKESRIELWSAPRWHYELIYEFLRDDATYNELQALAAFFLARRGAFDDFLFLDPDDAPVTAQPFGQADGVATTYQLVRGYGSFVEPVTGLITAPTIYVNAAQTTAVSWTTKGLVTFNSAPPSGAGLTWSGVFYRRVRFDGDKLDLNKFMTRLWEAQSVKLVTVK